MGTTRSFVFHSLGDALVPLIQRPVEDMIFEALDRRQIPTRADVKELREQVEALSAGLAALNTQLADLGERLSAVGQGGVEPEPKSKTLTCKVEGCDEAFRSKGFCAKHYQKWRRGTLPGYSAD